MPLKILTSSYSTEIGRTLQQIGIDFTLYIVKDFQQNLLSEERNGIDVVYFGGGSDVSPFLYGEFDKQIDSNMGRDLLELYIFKRYLNNLKIKYAGICRGSQFLNVMYGGTLWHDLPYEHLGHNYIHLVCQDEEYPDTPNLPHLSKFGITESPFYVNSTHHQAVKKLGNGLIRMLYDPTTRVTEGFYSDDGKTRAVQSHPEFLDKNYKYSMDMLKFLFRIGE